MPPVPALRPPSRRAIAAAQPSLAPRAGLLTRIGRAVKAAVQPATGGRILTSQQLAEELRIGTHTDSGIDVTPTSSMRVATVYRCVSIIADTMGMLPWRVYRRTADDRIKIEASHPVDVLLNRTPSRWQTPYQFKRWIGVCQCLRGNAYAFISRKNGVPVELVPLHPDHMTVEQIGDFDVRYTYTSFDGRREVIAPNDILHFYALSLNGLWGLSPIEAARQAVGLSLAAEKFGARFFGNGVRPTGVMKLPPGSALSDEAFKRLRDQLEITLSGVDNSHRVAIFENGAEWQSLSMSAVEAQYIEARQFQSDEICQFFGVPPFMVGNTQKSTSWGTGLDNQRIGFVIHTMKPRLVSAQDTANARLFAPGEEDELFTQFQIEDMTLPAIDTLATATKTMIESGVMSPNEARQRFFSMNPRDDAAGDDFVVPGKSIDSKATAQPAAKD